MTHTYAELKVEGRLVQKRVKTNGETDTTNFITFLANSVGKTRTIYFKSYTHTRLLALFPGLPRWAGTRKLKPVWILLKQETVSGSGISWAICKSAPRSRQITTPAPHCSVFFTGRMLFLPPNQQRQSTEGI